MTIYLRLCSYCTGDGAKDGLWTLDWTTVLCKLVGTLKVVPEKKTPVFNLISTHTYHNYGHSYTVECLFSYYRGLQVGWHKFVTKICACAHFWWGFELKIPCMCKLSSENLCQPTCKPLYRYLKLRPSVCQPTCKALYRVLQVGCVNTVV